MKVALAGTISGRGGIQTHLRGLAEALTQAGHTVMVFSLNGAPSAAEIPTGSIGGIQSLVSDGLFSSLRNAWELWRRTKDFRPDIYLACGTGWNLFLPAWLSRSCGWLVFHEVMSGEAGDWRDSRWAVKWLFDKVVAQAEPVARNFRRTFGWLDDIPVLPAFAESFKVIDWKNSVREVVPYGEGRAAIFGRLVPHKRVTWLVRQWPRLRESLKELHIFGTGPDSKAVIGAIREGGFEKEVFYHGAYPSGEEYGRLIQGFDLTLLPTVGAEGAPLVLLESMACGVPFVATDTGGISDYMSDDCVIVSKVDPASFLSAVEYLCGKMASGEIDPQRLQSFYRRCFSFEPLKAKWTQFLASL